MHGGAIGSEPIQYTNYKLMRHVFYCTPSQLAEQRIEDIQSVLVCLEVEATRDKFEKQKREWA